MQHIGIQPVGGADAPDDVAVEFYRLSAAQGGECPGVRLEREFGEDIAFAGLQGYGADTGRNRSEVMFNKWNDLGNYLLVKYMDGDVIRQVEPKR